jgi:AcrR family transcriptional regulator
VTATPPTETHLHATVDALLAEARTAGTRASVSALAERAGITRPTLYRNFPGVIARLRAQSAVPESATPTSTPAKPTAVQELRERITRLRHENEQLRLHLELYEEHIRRLTIENTRLATALAGHDGVTHLAGRRAKPTTR